ncbi:MAG TPA: hypothetical protein VGN82_03575 [Bosea sp. (in: a-proteobacteria)]|uniref:hypothetical protein n=1 Tax=Bosea sp. (in: a-proteobacteria) TaxID=1871050 RepID=UPI002E155D60|nr:hypothetical protein [Bosea sp. (in: a-proteobacteria)]
MSLKHFAVAVLLSSVGTASLAADLTARKPPPPPATPVASACSESEGIPTDAFGFTTGSDVADPGSFGPSLTYGGAYGTRLGSASGHGLQLQGSYGLAPCLEVGPYLLGGLSRSSFAGISADANSFGAGIETKYKLLGRDRHGIGLTAVIDPSFNRNDPDGAGRFTTYNTGLRLFADRTLIPGKLYAALNVSQDMTWTGPDPYARSSTFTVGGSLAWQVLDGVYLSGEVRHQRAYDTLGFSKEAGYATFAGPGVFWQATKQFAISAAYNVQVAGKAKNEPGNLDLTNFSQHLVKVKAAYSF